jgi:hypothetical protein
MRLRSSSHAPNLLQGERHQWHMLAIYVCLPQVEHIESGKFESLLSRFEMRRRWRVPERNDATGANPAREVRTSWQKQPPVEPSEEEVVDGINEEPI